MMQEEFEKFYRPLEDDAFTRKHWSEEVFAFTETYLQELKSTRAYEKPDADFGVGFGFTMPEKGQTIESALEWIKSKVVLPGIKPASGRHLGYVPGGGVFAAALGDFIADVTNSYAGIYYASPGAVKLENELIRWMIGLAGYPKDACGHLASGGSLANLTALVAARDHLNLLDFAPQTVCIYLTNHVHHCVHKAMRICGLGRAVVRIVDMDERFRMNTEHLEQLILEDKANSFVPSIVVGSLGTTDAGAIDPIATISQICKKHALWFHVDGAYGGAFLLLDTLKEQMKGVSESDSFVLDPHKGFFLPYGTGAVIIRHTDSVLKSHYYQASYMQDAYQIPEELSPADISPELTKHFRGLRMWLPFYLYGVGAFRDTLEEKLSLANWFYHEIKALGFITVGPPDLSILLYRLSDDIKNKTILEYIHDHAPVFISSTSIQGQLWLRAAFMSFRTHREQVQELLDSIKIALSNLVEKK